jgi:hypothetical protein
MSLASQPYVNLEKQRKILGERMKKAQLAQDHIQKILPCNIEAFDNQNIMVMGESVLD